MSNSKLHDMSDSKYTGIEHRVFKLYLKKSFTENILQNRRSCMKDKLHIVENINPSDIIKSIRDSFYGANIVYNHGSCAHLYNILKNIFKDAEMYSNSDHVITKIGNKYYDIDGEYDEEYIYDNGYMHIEDGIYNHEFKNYKFDISSISAMCPPRKIIGKRIELLEKLGVFDKIEELCNLSGFHKSFLMLNIYGDVFMHTSIIAAIFKLTKVDIQELTYINICDSL